MGSADSRATVLHRLVRDGKLAQIVANHLRLKINSSIKYASKKLPWSTRSMWGMGDIKILGHCSVSVCQYVCLCVQSGTISKFPYQEYCVYRLTKGNILVKCFMYYRTKFSSAVIGTEVLYETIATWTI